PDPRTLGIVFRDTFSSRMIPLIGLPLTKCSRLIRPIVSTTSIPRHPRHPKRSSLPTTANGGSKLDADHPSAGVNIPRRITPCSQFPDHHRRKIASVPREGTCAVGSLLSWLAVVTIGLTPILVYWLARVIGQALRRKARGPLVCSPRPEPEA